MKKSEAIKFKKRSIKVVFVCLFLLLISYFLFPASLYAERIKDIATFSGVRENELIGYGIVVGLNGTGDKDGTYIFQPFANMLTRMGVSVNQADIKGKTKNIAAVIVTAKLSTMVKPGSKVDVQVSSIGDAKSLQGGTLLMTPLRAPDNNVYAVAQGPFAKAESPSVVSVVIPDAYADKVVELMSTVELVNVDTDIPARVVVNERTGTVVIGENVGISPIALAHGGLTIEIKTEFQVSQPLPFAPEKAETVVVPQKEVKAEEKKASLTQVKGATIGELVKALNTLGVTPRDLVAILQAIKAAGSLKADLVIM
ncbi:MAG: flagellar basal body P-ring protein FlgI [Nitrospirae bacterium]|nr:flagellar basal body P-ring protein FlgI [Nitrospirota bacterium]